jgi:toxin secretion/phage lysis holin
MYRILQTLNIGENSLITTYTTVFCYIYNSFNLVIAVYSILLIIDYICGLFAYLKLHKFDKKKLLWGGIKKIFSFTMIIVAMLIDCLLCFLSAHYNIDIYNSGYLTIITSIILIATEGISIVEKWRLLELEVPFTLKQVFNFLKRLKNIEKK